MQQQQPPHRRLRDLALAVVPVARFVADDTRRVVLADLQSRSGFVHVERLRGATVLIATRRQLYTVLASIELDGVAQRVLLWTPNLLDHLPSIMRDAGVDWIVRNENADHPAVRPFSNQLVPYRFDRPGPPVEPDRPLDTEWVLFTSGTTGQPKMAVHTVSSLIGPLDDGLAVSTGAVWSTFYDIRRYGGLTILLRALLGGGSMVLSSPPCKPIGDFLIRAAASGVTISRARRRIGAKPSCVQKQP